MSAHPVLQIRRLLADKTDLQYGMRPRPEGPLADLIDGLEGAGDEGCE